MNDLPRELTGCEVLPPREDRLREAVSSPSTAAAGGKRNGSDRNGQKAKVAGRFHEFNAFIDTTIRSLSRSETAVWLVLFRDCRDGLARTGQEDIARRTGVCRKTVSRAVDQLVQKGLLEIVRKGGLNKGPSTYRVAPTCSSE